MSEYDDAVLADNPVRYWKGEDLSGTQATDSSGNNGHGVIEPTAVLGQPGPIETDGTSLAVKERFATATSPSGSDTDQRNNFTLEMWGRTEDLLGDQGLLTRLGQWGLSGSHAVGFNSGSIFARISDSAGTSYDLSHGPVLTATYYYIAVERNDTVLTLQVNDLEEDQRIDFPTGPIVRAAYNSAPWVLNSLRSTLTGGFAFPSDGGARFALYNTAIGYARRLAHYEAALLALFLNGRSDANPTAILRSDFEPDPISFPSLRHNWTEPFIERITFRSAIQQSVNGVEEAVSERLTPRRELEVTQVLRDNRERRKLRAQLWANQHAKWFFPVRQYAEQLSAPLAASATTVPIDIQYKDYEAGLWIGFRQYDGNGRVVHSEERLVISLNPLEFEPLVNDYAAYLSYVYPVRRALIPPAISVKGHTDSVEELVLTARLLPEDEAEVPNRITQFTPSIKYRDYEVFDGQLWQSNDWSEQREYEITRAGEPVDFDTGLMGFNSDTIGATETFSYRMVLSEYINIAAFLGWFYERRGALAYLWVPTMQEDFEILSIDGDQITVRDTDYSDSYVLAEPRRDLAFVYQDGSMEFRRVIAFEGTVNETLTLGANVPTTTNLRMVSLLKFCRLDTDQLELVWHTDNVVQVAWRFHEPPHTPEGTGLSSLSPSASLSGSLSPSHSASPSPSVSPSLSPSLSPSPSASISPSTSQSPSHSASPSASLSATPSLSPSPSASESVSASPSQSPSSSTSLSPSPSSSASPSA